MKTVQKNESLGSSAAADLPSEQSAGAGPPTGKGRLQLDPRRGDGALGTPQVADVRAVSSPPSLPSHNSDYWKQKAIMMRGDAHTEKTSVNR